MIVYGLIAYIGIIALTIGYFIVKKMGDRANADKNLEEEDPNVDDNGNPSGDVDSPGKKPP